MKFDILNKTNLYNTFATFQYLPRWFIFLFDSCIAFLSFYFSNLIAANMLYEMKEPAVVPSMYRIVILLSTQMTFFWIFRTHQGILRYSAFIDALRICWSVLFTFILLLSLNYIYIYILNMKIFYFSSLIIYGLSSFLLLMSVRIAVKLMFDFLLQNVNETQNVMIYGSKASGVAIAKALKVSDKRYSYRLVGFVDDDTEIETKMLMGVKVYPLNEKSIKKAIAKNVKSIIVSSRKMDDIDPKNDLDIFLDNGIKILTVPAISEYTEEEKPQIKDLKSIKIEDLLERSQIKISTSEISTMLKDKVILVTGATGSIGSEIVRQCVNFDPKLIVLLDNAETPMHELTLRLNESYPKLHFAVFLTDVRNKARLMQLMDMYKIDVIFHAAAYKHVPLMEDNPTESIQVNVLGTKNLADLAVEYEVSRFVMISTDKAVNPSNVMGASKRLCEMYVQSLNNKLKRDGVESTKFITTRFGNVLGSNGSVIPLFKRQIASGGPITVTHPDIIRYFMTIPEACLLVLQAGTMGDGGEIFVFDMGQQVKIVDLAKKMIVLSGLKPNVDIEIHFTGLRQGEKLYEELLNQKEKTKPTHHEKITIAQVREFEFDVVSEQIDKLISDSYLCKDFVTVDQMKKIVPEFKSKNSIYEKLDLTNNERN